MISLAEKLNEEVEQNTADVAAAVEEAEKATELANTAAVETTQATHAAQTATGAANTAAANANAARDDILQRWRTVSLKGRRRQRGPRGPGGQRRHGTFRRNVFPVSGSCDWRSIRGVPGRIGAAGV